MENETSEQALQGSLEAQWKNYQEIVAALRRQVSKDKRMLQIYHACCSDGREARNQGEAFEAGLRVSIETGEQAIALYERARQRIEEIQQNRLNRTTG